MGYGNSGAMIPETTLNFKAEEMMVWGKQKKKKDRDSLRLPRLTA